MSITNDGGPAFPMPSGPEPREKSTTHYNEGMTLRDYFAAAAIDNNMREAVEWYQAGNACDVYARAATGAYRMADALLAARGEVRP